MNRYRRLVTLFWSTAIAAEMEYRLNFVLSALTSVGNLTGSLFGLFLFYRTGYNFQGWSWDAALIVLGIFTLLQGFATTFLAPNLNSIVKQVEAGTLDFVLLKPISSQFWLSTRNLSPWGMPDLALGLLTLVYAGQHLGLGFWDYGRAVLPLSLGFVILYSLWFMLAATSIWFVKIYNVTEVLRGLLEAGRFPAAAYPASFRLFFTFVVPVTFLTTVPAETLLGRGEPIWILGSTVLAIAFAGISHAFWKFALRFYTSASS